MNQAKTVFVSSFYARLPSLSKEQVQQLKTELVSWRPYGPVQGSANHYNFFDVLRFQDVNSHLTVSSLNDGDAIAYLKELSGTYDFETVVIVSEDMLLNVQTETCEDSEFLAGYVPHPEPYTGKAGYGGTVFEHHLLVDQYAESTIYTVLLHRTFIPSWLGHFAPPPAVEGEDPSILRDSAAIGHAEWEQRSQAVEVRLKELAG